MTTRQIALVQTSFAMMDHPMAVRLLDLLFSKLFELDPSLQQGMFRDVEMQQQKAMLLFAVGDAVHYLDNFEYVAPAFKALGQKHVGFGVTEVHYDLVGQALMFALAQVMGDVFTGDLKKAWEQFYKKVTTAMQS